MHGPHTHLECRSRVPRRKTPVWCSGFRVASAALAVVGGLLAITQAARTAEYSGRAIHIEDGDTFDMRGDSEKVRIRLCGIDSPERGHAGYRPAKAALSALIGGKIVRCVQVGAGTPCDGRSRPTNRKRVVAQCFLDSMDVAIEMVRGGNACDWPKFSNGYYRIDPTTCINPK